MVSKTSTENEDKELPKEYKPLYISTKLIRSNPLNPRTEVDKDSDAQLLQSVAIRGVETPIHIRPIPEDGDGHLYEVYDGDRRLRAAIKAKIATVPVLILSKTDDEVLEFGVVSTIRRNLGDVEMGRALLELQKRFSSKYPNQRAMARNLGISTARINQFIKLVINLDPRVQDLVAPSDQTGKIPEGAIDGRLGYEISKIPDKERQVEVAQEIITHPKLKGDKARLLALEAREEPETEVTELSARRFQEVETRHPTLIMDAKDYEALRSGEKRILIERTIRPGLHEDVTVNSLIRGEPLEIADAFKRPLGRFKAMDVKGAGFKDLETFKEYWQDKYGVEWNPQETAHVIIFKQ